MSPTMSTSEQEPAAEKPKAIDRFFAAIAAKTSDPAHRRLLAAAKESRPLDAMTKELARLAQEILDAP